MEVCVFFFFFFNYNPFDIDVIRRSCHLVFGEKLLKDGYCDIGMFIRPQLNKYDIYEKLKTAGSPFAYLYASNQSFPKSKDIKNNGVEFLKSKLEMKDAYSLSLMEAQAVLNWIFKSGDTIAEKKVIAEDLISALEPQKSSQTNYLLENDSVFYDPSRVQICFIKSIEDFNVFIQQNQTYREGFYYRGHSQLNYMLNPSLMRRQSWKDHERDMYNELMIQCPQDFQHIRTHLDILVHMQHYNLPTRLLDITGNPLVALYFACEQDTSSLGEIIVFDVEAEKIKYPNSDAVSLLASLPLFRKEEQQLFLKAATDKHTDQEYFNKQIVRLLHEVKSEKPAFRDEVNKEDLVSSFVVRSSKSNNRIIKQDGAFIICGLAEDHSIVLNSFRYKNDSKSIVYILEDKKNIMQQLKNFAVTKASLFPEIDDVADFIKQRY